MTARQIIAIFIGLLMIGVALYMRTAPQRLFTRPGDSSQYRPQATELESEHGVFLTRTFPPILIVVGLALIAYQLISYLSE